MKRGRVYDNPGEQPNQHQQPNISNLLFKMLISDYTKIVSVIQFSCYMQPKAFLSETTAILEF